MGILDRIWRAVGERLWDDSIPAADPMEKDARDRARSTAPVVWLIGKTGAGKTAIVSALTGDARATIGEGFEPCTRTSLFYDVPPEAPLLRFLDTRGLGEPGYDPAQDIAWCEHQSHLLLVVMQVSDPMQDDVLRVVRTARRRHPYWPVVVAQTGLHRRYEPGAPHPASYPYTGGASDEADSRIPHALRQAIAYQRRLFSGLPGDPVRFVPIDFTVPEDGYDPEDFGLAALWQALEETGPDALAAFHRALADAETDEVRASARRVVQSFAAVAAGAGAVPFPLVGAGGLAGVLALMLRMVGRRYDVVWTPGMFAQFTGAIGGGALAWWIVRYGLGESVKLIPFLGTAMAGALNAAAAVAITVGIGEAACVWLGYRRRGQSAPTEEVRRAFATGLAEGLRRVRTKGEDSREGPHGER
jgi:uncharacterized protein (DUF697 family)